MLVIKILKKQVKMEQFYTNLYSVRNAWGKLANTETYTLGRGTVKRHFWGDSVEYYF